MKQKIFYILPLVAMVFICGCKKIINPKPEFQIDASQPLETIQQAEFVATGMYAALRSVQLYSSNNDALSAYAALPDIMSDNLVETFESLGNQRTFSEWTYSSDDGNIYAMWIASYQVIARTNLILRDIDKFSGSSPLAVNRIKGQALALRAHMHFSLLRYFAPSYRRNSDSLGIPYVKLYDVKYKPARGTIKENYDNILADLNQAKVLLGNIDRPINDADRGLIDIHAVNGLLARVNFFAGEWNDAINAANAAIAAKPLASPSEFFRIWTDESTEEVLWSVNFTSATEGTPYGGVYFTPRGTNIYRPAPELLSMYNSSTDVRYSAYFKTTGGRTIVSKHNGASGNGVVNWKVLRTGEMYLIRAEAYYMLGNQTAALQNLDALRAARIGGFVTGGETGTALFNAIQTERRKELAFESDRFFNLKRLGRLPITRSACGTAGNSPSTICSLASASRAWTFPIPANDIIVNPSLVQNPGY
jgi:starch-binding outer membrane protein, SusD/RagB family